jgi:Flp pilus assembly protein TadD
MNPQQAAYRQELANAFAGQGDWSAAQNEAREAIALDPARTTARTILAIALFRAGSTAEADQQFHTVELLAPANLDRLRQRYTSERNRP